MCKQETLILGKDESEGGNGNGKNKTVYQQTAEGRYQISEDENSIYELDITCMDKRGQQIVAERT